MVKGFNYNLSLSEEQFAALTPIEQDIVARLAKERPAREVPARRPIRFTMVETPESVAQEMANVADQGQGVDLTQFSNLPKRRIAR